MNTTENPDQEHPKGASMPWWMGFVLALIVWEVVPWAISLLTYRYGWAAGSPGLWNLLGLIPVVIGSTGLIWSMVLHSVKSPKGIEWELDKSYLLRGGLYTFSRNPMYLSELVLMFGWVIFYGSVALLIAFVVPCLFFNFYAVPLEERAMEAHFGEAYLEYKKRVPRWFGQR